VVPKTWANVSSPLASMCFGDVSVSSFRKSALLAPTAVPAVIYDVYSPAELVLLTLAGPLIAVIRSESASGSSIVVQVIANGDGTYGEGSKVGWAPWSSEWANIQGLVRDGIRIAVGGANMCNSSIREHLRAPDNASG
jgi:hypothetical protein